MVNERTIRADEIDGYVAQLGTGFHFEVAPGYPEYLLGTIDVDRTHASFDGDRIVGTMRSVHTEFTVPGPRVVPASALTNVTVAPTHRRQGRLTAMIDLDLRASRERGELLSVLIASEYPIYGRFGYGPAIETTRYTVHTREADFLREPRGTVELTDRATLRREGPVLYDRFRRGQPGSIERPDHWWDRALRQAEVPGLDPLRGKVAIYRSPDGIEGYVQYEAKPEWDGMRPKGVVHLHELVALTPDAYHALWSYCCGIDLVTTIEARERPTDEVLPHLLADGRAVKLASRSDFVWARILDVAASLGSRTYAAPGRLVLEVVDDTGPCSGRFVLDGGPDGATCGPTTEDPDLTMPIDALGSIFLGGTAPRTLELAGLIDAPRDGAVATADAMFRTSRAPWCNTWF